jgi:drug/metabolite transporter (DMT)-like permease
MLWFILSLLSVFALAAAELVQQYLLNLKNAFNERTSAVLTFLLQSLLVFPIILFSPYRSQLLTVFDRTIIFKLAAVTAIASVAMIFYLKSFKVKNISFSAIFVSCSVIVSTALGIIFLNESWHILKFIGIALILLAIFFLNYKNVGVEKNNYYGLAAGLMFGISYTLWQVPISSNTFVQFADL